jgi:hypothetical protein
VRGGVCVCGWGVGVSALMEGAGRDRLDGAVIAGWVVEAGMEDVWEWWWRW